MRVYPVGNNRGLVSLETFEVWKQELDIYPIPLLLLCNDVLTLSHLGLSQT